VAENNQWIAGWHFLYIIFPIAPFFLGGGIRVIFSRNVNLATFNFSDLAICLAILSLLMFIDLYTDKNVLKDPIVKKAARRCAWWFVSFIILFSVLFSVNIQLITLIYDVHLSMYIDSLFYCDIITSVFAIIVLIYSAYIQKKFRLGADIDEIEESHPIRSENV
jgi:hypothetical protein